MEFLQSTCPTSFRVQRLSWAWQHSRSIGTSLSRIRFTIERNITWKKWPPLLSPSGSFPCRCRLFTSRWATSATPSSSPTPPWFWHLWFSLCPMWASSARFDINSKFQPDWRPVWAKSVQSARQMNTRQEWPRRSSWFWWRIFCATPLLASWSTSWISAPPAAVIPSTGSGTCSSCSFCSTRVWIHSCTPGDFPPSETRSGSSLACTRGSLGQARGWLRQSPTASTYHRAAWMFFPRKSRHARHCQHRNLPSMNYKTLAIKRIISNPTWTLDFEEVNMHGTTVLVKLSVTASWILRTLGSGVTIREFRVAGPGSKHSRTPAKTHLPELRYMKANAHLLPQPNSSQQ